MQSGASTKKLVRRERSYAWLVALPLFIGCVLFWGLCLSFIAYGFIQLVDHLISDGTPWLGISIIVIALAVPAWSFLLPLRMILWPIINPVGYCESNMGVVFVQDNEEYSALTEVVNDLAKKAGINKIAYIGIQPEEVNAFAFGFLPSKSVVAIGEGLLKRMNLDELRAVIGHEIGHIASRDCLASTMVGTVKLTVDDGILKPLQWLLSAFGFGFLVGSAVTFPRTLVGVAVKLGLMIIGLYILAIYTAMKIGTWALRKLVEFLECWLSRRREYKADRVGSLLAGQESMISALQALRTISGTGNLQLVSDPFAAFKFINFKQLHSSREWTWLSDTHPPMRRRIEALMIGKTPPMAPLARWILALAATSSYCWLLISLGMQLDAEGLHSQQIIQPILFAGMQFASLSGAVFGFFYAMRRTQAGWQCALLTLLSWRVCYFPIMVFSGHVAAISEWLLAKTSLPAFVYPVFLIAVALLHTIAAVAACWLMQTPSNRIRIARASAFLAAFCVSFSKPADLHPLPDTNWSLARVTAPAVSAPTANAASGATAPAAEMAYLGGDPHLVALGAKGHWPNQHVVLLTAHEAVAAARQRGGNPYLAALGATGYWPNQRVVLLAAGLTYGAIPPSPWARAVRDDLAERFAAQPHGGAALRVREHYLAYHAAHRQIGCQRRSDCAATPQ